jgi:hypothetical protein
MFTARSLRYVKPVKDRHGGADRHYFRLKNGKLTPMRGGYGSAEFVAHHAELMAQRTGQKAHDQPRWRGESEAAELAKAARSVFWRYCERIPSLIRQRARPKGIPVAIDKHFIDQLFVDQNWRCAVSGIPFSPSFKNRRHPFVPTIDRKIPALGYVPGNIRIVCSIVNSAMSDWGEDALLVLLDAMGSRPKPQLKTKISHF